MGLSASCICKLISIVYSLSKKSPLKKVSKNELEAAIRDAEGLKYESNQRECLNRVLCHLESAYTHFEPKTWNFLDDENRVLWDQRTYKNSICMAIAVIHYILGNLSQSKRWISEELSEYGWINMPEGSLSLLGMNGYEDFFNSIFMDNGETYRQLEWSIKCHFNSAYDDGGYNPFGTFY